MTEQQEPKWIKAKRSQGTNNECVEVAFMGAAVWVRDSKNVAGGKLTFSAKGWDGLLNTVREDASPDA